MPLVSSSLDIYENPSTKEIIEKVRSFRTEIDTTFAADPRISFHSERLTLDTTLGETPGAVLAVNHQPAVTRPLSAVATEVVTVFDPVLGKDVTVSVAGISLGIKNRYVAWYAEDKAAAKAAADAAAAAGTP